MNPVSLYQIHLLRQSRLYLLEQVSHLSTEELNTIPHGFNNNILWNLGHLIAAQQGICYRRAGLPMSISGEFYSAFQPGSRPDHFMNATFADKVRGLLVSTIDLLEQDYKRSVFHQYAAWTTRYGATLATIDDALAFLPFHEGLHQGAIAAIKKLVSK